MENNNCELPWANRHMKNSELMIMNLEESSKVTKSLKKVLEDIEVEKGSLDKLASSSDKMDKRKYYYDTAIMTADKKREQLTDELRELKDQLFERENVEELFIQEIDNRANEKIEKLQKQIEQIQRDAEAEKKAIREAGVSDIAAKKLQEKNKSLKNKISKIEDEIERQDNRLKSCRDDMERLNIDPISKRLATLEEKKKYFETKQKELQKELEHFIAVEQSINKERDKAIEKEYAIERAKNPPRQTTSYSYIEMDNGKSHWENYQEQQNRMVSTS
jgi:DNA repair exonuclease SbcCD ATPase subunit